MLYETSRITFLWGHQNPLLPPVLKRVSAQPSPNSWDDFVATRRQLPWHIRIAVVQRDSREVVRAAARIQLIFRQWLGDVRRGPREAF